MPSVVMRPRVCPSNALLRQVPFPFLDSAHERERPAPRGDGVPFQRLFSRAEGGVPPGVPPGGRFEKCAERTLIWLDQVCSQKIEPVLAKEFATSQIRQFCLLASPHKQFLPPRRVAVEQSFS